MTAKTPSLFLALHKWARMQDENFCTEGLIFLLRLTLQEVPKDGLKIVDFLSGGLIGSRDRPTAIVVSGQIHGDEGRPDFEIRFANRIAWIEVKVESKVGATQFVRYRRMLNAITPTNRLILLSRGGDDLADDSCPDEFRRWIDLSSRLEDCLKNFENRGSRSEVYLRDYLTFLGTKQMKLNHVKTQVAASITDVGSLLLTIKESIRREGFQPEWSYSESNLGYFIENDQGRLGWMGFHVSDPQWLFYTTEGSKARIDISAVEGCQLPGAQVMDGKHWTNCMDLVECKEFFDQEPDGQVQYLQEHLVHPSIEFFRSIRLNS